MRFEWPRLHKVRAAFAFFAAAFSLGCGGIVAPLGECHTLDCEGSEHNVLCKDRKSPTLTSETCIAGTCGCDDGITTIACGASTCGADGQLHRCVGPRRFEATGVACRREDCGGSLPTGTQCVFDDEFSGEKVDPNLWVVDDFYFSVTAESCQKAANVSESSGVLSIVGRQEDATCSGTGDGNPDHPFPPVASHYTAGDVSMRSFAFTYGTLTTRVRLAGGGGTWSAGWLLGSRCQTGWGPSPALFPGVTAPTLDHPECGWPAAGAEEIDLFELAGPVDGRFVHQGLNGVDGWQQTFLDATGVDEEWHVFRMVWAPGSLQISKDGVTTLAISGSNVPSTPMFLILSMGIGGHGGAISGLPRTSLVDYVRITQP